MMKKHKHLNKTTIIIIFALLILWRQNTLHVDAWLPTFQSPINTPTPTPPFQTLTPTPGPTHTLTPTETPYPTRTPTATWTPVPTHFAFTPEPGNTYTPTSTPTPTDTATPTHTPTNTPTPTDTATPTHTPSPTHTPKPTSISTPLPTVAPTPTPVAVPFNVPYLDEIACNQTDWQQSGLWHISEKRSYSPDCAWWYGQETINTYDANSPNHGDLTSPLIILPSGQLLKLRFATRWEVETARPGRDLMLIQIQGDDETWQTLHQLGGEFVALRRIGLAAPLPTAEKWRIETIDLSAYAEQTIRIRFHFDTVDAENNNFEGWWVDDVTIEVDNPPVYLPETGGVNDNSHP